MVTGPLLTRRRIMALTTALVATPRAAWPQDYIDLNWQDLLPEGSDALPSALRALLPHDETATPLASQPTSSEVRTDWNGMIVRLPGYVLPTEYDGTGVTAFILVPFVGACVHVPPPPPNQLVFVTTQTPYEMKGIFEAVNVIGMFGTAATSTQQINIGYALSADEIVPFG